MHSDSINDSNLLESLLQEGLSESLGEPIVCRVEVDLKGWMSDLTGGKDWEVFEEEENESCVTFLLRHGKQNAEVTLYQTGYAIVDVDGSSLFDGNLTEQHGRWTHLSYFNALSGDPITLN